MVDEYKKERSSENIAKTNVVDEDEVEQSSEVIEPSRKRRRVEEEQEDQPMVNVLPARGQERPLEDVKPVKKARVELRFTLIMEEELDIHEQEPLAKPADFNRVGNDMLDEARRVRRCWHWVLVASKTSAYCLKVYNRVVLVNRCLELLKSKEAQARLAELDWFTIRHTTFEEKEEWLKNFLNDMDAIKNSSTAMSTEDDMKRGPIAEEFLDLLFYASRMFRTKSAIGK
eukprot:IDg23838t1